MKPQVYKFVKRFGRAPGGRRRDEGPLSGQEFFEDVLTPMKAEGKPILLDLTGAMGFATAFLDGAFGEFGKQFGEAAFREIFTIVAEDDPTLEFEIEKALRRGEGK